MSGSKFIIKKNRLLRNNETCIIASGDIIDYLVIEDKIIVIIDPEDLNNDRNVFCYKNGYRFWQIDSAPKLHSKNYFTSIYLSENNELLAYSKSGIEVTINKENGVVIKKELIK